MDPQIEAFITHRNYAECLKTLTDNLSINFTRRVSRISLPYLNEKDNLINLTKRSLEDEHRIVQIDRDYSFASTAWLPIKSYHLIYNLLLKIAYVINTDKRCFSYTHKTCGNFYTSLIESGELVFNQTVLNQVFDRDILNFRATSGANLTRRTPTETMYKLAIRKVANYKHDFLKRNLNLRTRIGKAENEVILNNFSISLLEFPCYMRHRSHYRDFAFIDGISTLDTSLYFNTYYSFIFNLYDALIRFCNELVHLRNT